MREPITKKSDHLFDRKSHRLEKDEERLHI